MFLSVIGFAFVIIATYFVYKKAQDYGRNAVGWSIITFSAGIGMEEKKFVRPLIPPKFD